MNVWLFLLSGAGFLISFYIYHTKKNNRQLVCMLGKACNQVVESKYGTVLGVPNEVVGLFYYALIAVSALVTLNPALATTRLVLSAGAAAAGLGLLFIQAFVLKKWCEYCVGSALISLAIFLVAYVV